MMHSENDDQKSNASLTKLVSYSTMHADLMSWFWKWSSQMDRYLRNAKIPISTMRQLMLGGHADLSFLDQSHLVATRLLNHHDITCSKIYSLSYQQLAAIWSYFVSGRQATPGGRVFSPKQSPILYWDLKEISHVSHELNQVSSLRNHPRLQVWALRTRLPFPTQQILPGEILHLSH